MKLNFKFISVAELKRWLEAKNRNFNSAEEYDEWLQEFFDNGNTISVRNERYDYWACWELL